ncbi:MAG: TetR/AcrR family transcriptional regulator [Bacteroidota bacterium]
MEETLKNLLYKIKEIFLRYGIKSVTMDDLARELGMSKKTLYQYVNDKNELVDKIVSLEIEGRKCEFGEIYNRNLNAIEEVFEVNKHVLKMLKESSPAAGYDLKKYYPDLFAKVQETRRNQMLDSIINNIKKGKAEGMYREEVNEEIIARINVARFENLLNTDIFQPEEYNSKAFIREVLIYHIRGISNERGIEILQERLKDFDEYIQSIK